MIRFDVHPEFEQKRGQIKPPVRGSSKSAGLDVHAIFHDSVAPYSRKLIPTGLMMTECPDNVYVRIAPRSSLSLKGTDISAGVVDSDYRGHIMVLFVNNTSEIFDITEGQRIAQFIPTVFYTGEVKFGQMADSGFVKTERGSGGFGSTGTH